MRTEKILMHRWSLGCYKNYNVKIKTEEKKMNEWKTDQGYRMTNSLY